MMEMLRNLSTPEKRALFRAGFQKLVETEAFRLCRDREKAALLAEYVFLKAEKEYASRLLPSYCEPFLVGQTCLAYAVAGRDMNELKRLVAEMRDMACQRDGECNN